MMNKSIKANNKDNVATTIQNLSAGERIQIEGNEFCLNQDVLSYHKFALMNIKKGEGIIKYGEAIGVASKDILAGDLVHVHNIESVRGRGDKK